MYYKKIITCLSKYAILMLVFSSCDNDYDLSKDINTDINIGKNLEIPVGKTDSIFLSRIIKPSTNLTVNNSGIYELDANGNFSSMVSAINPVTIKGLDPIFNNITITLPQYQITSIVITKEIENNTNYDIKTMLPKEVETISGALIRTVNDGEVTTNLNIYVSNLPKGINRIDLKNITIHFPEIFDIKNAVAGTLNLGNITFDQNNPNITLPIKIDGFSISDAQESKYITNIDGHKYFVMDDDLKITGTVEIDANPSLFDKKNLTIHFDYTVPDIEIYKVSGTLKPDASVSSDITLDGIPEFIKNSNNHFTPSLISFNLDVSNSINMSLNSTISIYGWNDKNNTQLGEAIVIPLNDVPGNTNSKYIISNKPIEVSHGEINIVQSNLVDLLSSIPDSYKISINNIEAKSLNKDQYYELDKSYNLSGKYNVDIPFEFSKFELQYADSINNLQKDLKDVSGKIKKLIVSATGVSTIPADLNVGVRLLDAHGNELKELTVNLDKFLMAASVDNKETESPLEITITEPEDCNQLENLETIEYTVHGLKLDNANTITLRSKQFIIIKKIIAKIPNGISLTL